MIFYEFQTKIDEKDEQDEDSGQKTGHDSDTVLRHESSENETRNVRWR